MKLTFCLCAALVVGSFIAVAADSTMSPAGNFPPAATHSTTNSGTNDDDVVVPVPASQFTNSAGMEMLKTGDGMWAGKYVVTQAQYQKVAGGNPSAFPGDANPVESVSWNDAMAFCDKLTEKELKAKALPKGFFYTLPTDGEWDTLKADAEAAEAVTSQSTRRTGTAPVGSLGPNSLGLYDTLGNVLEFTLGDTNAPTRLARGVSWADRIEMGVVTQFRTECKPGDAKNIYGFRVVLKGK